LKVGALLVDYDGTIAPLGVPREESRIIGGVEIQLRRIAEQIPLCLVTAKDFDFIHPRSRFASAWACVSGLDIRLADGRHSTRKDLMDLREVTRLARSTRLRGSYAELKHGPSGELLGVTIDWTEALGLKPLIRGDLRRLSNNGFIVVHDEQTSYADVYAASPNKGSAVAILKRLLSIKRKVMFIGDSPLDNTAFQEAGIAIGVAHGQPTEELRCDFVVEQTRLEEFLRSLSDRGLDFTPSISAVKKRGSVGRIESRGHHVSDKSVQGAGAGGAEDGKGAKERGT
jgi:hypothetical protein